MKKEAIIVMIVLLASISFISCGAQTVIYGLGTNPEERNTDNFYMKDINNDHDAILGIWKWEDATELFEITLQEFEMENYPSSFTHYYDSVYGKYKYVVNGNTISEVPSINPLPNAKLSLHFETPTKYYVVIKDVVSNRAYNGTFELTSPTIAVLKLKPSPGIKISPTGTLPNFVLPTSVTLTKQ